MLSVDTFDTLAEAASAMSDRSQFLGGGTLVMRGVNYGDQSFDRIIRTRDTSLREISAMGERVRIGAAVTMSMILQSRELQFLAPAARAVGGPAIRTMATVGGNLFARHPYGDFATALLALDAEIEWSDGRREPIETVLQGRDRANGLVAAVIVPRPQEHEFRFSKVSRVKPKGVSLLSLAVWLPRQAGRLANVRIAFGAMGSTPMRAKACENALANAELTEAGIEAALRVACDGLSPQDDAQATAWYRREVAPVYLRRLLLQERRL